jgi:hypothetical protein
MNVLQIVIPLYLPAEAWQTKMAYRQGRTPHRLDRAFCRGQGGHDRLQFETKREADAFRTEIENQLLPSRCRKSRGEGSRRTLFQRRADAPGRVDDEGVFKMPAITYGRPIDDAFEYEYVCAVITHPLRRCDSGLRS